MKNLHLRLICPVSAILLSSPGMAVDFGTYRALYELEPARIDQAAGSQPLDGKIAYEVTGSACAGFTVDSDYTTRYTDADQNVRAVDTKSSVFETGDGLQLQVSQTQSVNKEVTDDAKITAIRTVAGGEAQAEQQGTKKQQFKLGGDVLFPTAHQQKLLAAAQAGETRDVSVIYDGSDGAKQFRVVSFIGKKRAPGTYAPDLANPEAQALQTMASWTFQLGYYPLDNPQAEIPDFQATFNMYENGVTTEMLFDYGPYSMKGTLKHFEAIAAQPCDAPAPDSTTKAQ
ncbi:EipB family protein [Aestuariivirga litoralis]|uniref:EipB family protein n=1 Tax=Aestuariivirga litoralis TaxID=2650924 RepID=UPI0018C6B4DF|nr:DUF1849 family protein [Aestuariivirga litoralis]MBG1231628.1 DUF1849 family protein [Aestuariivirga litoralis]